MVESSPQLFNPCLLDENEQIPAKIWELLRRNRAFGDIVKRLTKLDAKERGEYKKTGNYHGAAWHRSWRLVQRVSAQHPFAGVALQWLVPEPLFQCYVATWPRGKKWRRRGEFLTRFLRVGEGVTPNVNGKDWTWRNPEKPDVGGHPIRRGPEVSWTQSRFKRLRDRVNPILEWRRYPWPFTLKHSWSTAPPGFRREFQFIWRRRFDSRPKNPLTNDRSDSPAPREVSFFHDWNLAEFRASGYATKDDLYQMVRFNDIARDYRVFAIPKTILTKASARVVGQWLADELKRGSDLYGDLLKRELLDEGELFGLHTEWADWVAYQTNQTHGRYKDAHFYRRCHFMDSLAARVFPSFNLAKLLSKPTHRARGKQYHPKGRNE